MKKRSLFMVILTAVLAVLLVPFKAVKEFGKRYWEGMVDSQLFVKTTKAQAMSVSIRGNQIDDAEITVTQSASGTFAAAIQLKGVNGKDLTAVGALLCYLSKDSDGSTVAVNSTDITSLAISGDGLFVPYSTNVSGLLVSESDGDINLAVEVPAGKVVYLVLVLPDGTLVISDAMTYGM